MDITGYEFSIDFRNWNDFIENCWVIYISITPEIRDARWGSDQTFEILFRNLFFLAVNSLDDVLHLSSSIITNETRSLIQSLGIPDWVKGAEFRISRGVNHPLFEQENDIDQD